MEDPDKIMPGLNLASVIVYFYFPLLIIVVCYVWIFVKIKQKVDQKVAARLEQLEMITCSAQLTNQVILRLISQYLSKIKIPRNNINCLIAL